MKNDIETLIYNFDLAFNNEKQNHYRMWIERSKCFIDSYLSSLPKDLTLYEFLTNSNYNYSLDSVYKLYCETDSEPLLQYLISLPAMTNDILKKSTDIEIDIKCYENHGYICMYLINYIYKFENNFHSIESQLIYNIFKKYKTLDNLKDFCNTWGIDWDFISKKELELISLNFLEN